MNIHSKFIKKGCNPTEFPPGDEPIGRDPPIYRYDDRIIAIQEESVVARLGERNNTRFLQKMLQGLSGVGFASLDLPFCHSSFVSGVYISCDKPLGPKFLKCSFFI
eukprot:gnl/Carplike_NY0171/35184_a175489_32.p1 GENE.gnl/Carplike_NY0171/35184_a175489_32~~gnl/Carplike_NY0171/35184_a175489_32.p1  ORF type:complete len:106 (+),score=14.23 gnl/Carplike_NY0171/35184_a175489_32:66-383(+)